MILSTNDERIEIRLHGRGGQGTVTLAALIVDAGFRSGWKAIGFPAFGTERAGAPVAAFVRLARAPIRDRSEIRRPSVIVVQDPTLISAVNVLEGMTNEGLVLLNASRIPSSIAGAAVFAYPVTDLARQHLGVAKTSTAMLGLVAAVTDLFTIDAVCAAIGDRFRGEIATRNVALARATFEAVGGETAAA